MVLSQGMRYIPGASMRIPQSVYGMHGLGAAVYDEYGNVVEGPSVFDNLPKWLQQVQTAVNSQRIFNENMERAERGLPPLNTSQYSPTVNVGLGVSAETQKMLLIGAAALVAVLILSKR